MEIKLDILEPFFKYPNKGYTIRGVAEKIKINHTTIRKYLIYYSKEGILVKKENSPYPIFIANVESKRYLNLKLYYNLDLLWGSQLIKYLEVEYNYSPIVLFGSFSKAMDDEQSDIDICIISDIKKDLDLSKFEKILGRKVSVHHFTKKQWNISKKKNPELLNNIANGITLSGQIEIL